MRDPYVEVDIEAIKSETDPYPENVFDWSIDHRNRFIGKYGLDIYYRVVRHELAKHPLGPSPMVTNEQRLQAEVHRLRNIIEAATVHDSKLKHALRDAVAMIPKGQLDAADLERLGEIVGLL